MPETPLPELLPCPFCGGIADIKRFLFDGSITAGCVNECEVGPETVEFVTADAAIKAWNTRSDIAEARIAAVTEQRDMLQRTLETRAERELEMLAEVAKENAELRERLSRLEQLEHFLDR